MIIFELKSSGNISYYFSRIFLFASVLDIATWCATHQLAYYNNPHSTWLSFGHRSIIPKDIEKGVVCYTVCTPLVHRSMAVYCLSSIE